MTTMLELAARAVDWWAWDGDHSKLHPNAMGPHARRQESIRIARAVLMAVREVDSDMASDATDELDVYWGYWSDGRPGSPSDCFASIIDAILAEKA